MILANFHLSLCRHLLNSSFLEFDRVRSQFLAILAFSLRQRLHLGLHVLADLLFKRTEKDTRGLNPWSLNSQTFLDRVV